MRGRGSMRVDEIGGRFGQKLQRPSRHGMREGKAERVEERPMRAHGEVAVARGIAVERVADDGMPQMGGVDADLVRPPRFDAELDKRERALFLQRLPVRDGAGAARFDDGHAPGVPVFAADQRLKCSVAGIRRPVENGQIRLDDFHVPLEKRPQRSVGAVGFGHDHHAARLLVEAVDDPRPRDAAHAGEAGAVGQQGVDERARRVAGRGVDDHSGRFVHDKEVGILEENVDGNPFGLRHGGDVVCFHAADYTILACARPRRRLFGVADTGGFALKCHTFRLAGETGK